MAKKEKKNLNAQVSDDLLESASGGYVFNAGHIAGDRSKQHEVIDDSTGGVLGRYATHDEAVYAAAQKGQSGKSIGWNEVTRLRGS